MSKFLVALFILSMAVTVQADYIESILGFSKDFDGIEYQVLSGGCTTKESFELKVLQSSPARLQLIRIIGDPCEAAPKCMIIKYSWSEIGLRPGDRFVVANPCVVTDY